MSPRAAPSDSWALFGLDGQIADSRVGSTSTTSESSGTPRLRCTRTTAGDGFTGRGRRKTQQSGRTLPVCRAAGSLGTRPNTSPGWTPCAPNQEPWTMLMPRVKRSRALSVQYRWTINTRTITYHGHVELKSCQCRTLPSTVHDSSTLDHTAIMPTMQCIIRYHMNAEVWSLAPGLDGPPGRRPGNRAHPARLDKPVLAQAEEPVDHPRLSLHGRGRLFPLVRLGQRAEYYLSWSHHGIRLALPMQKLTRYNQQLVH